MKTHHREMDTHAQLCALAVAVISLASFLCAILCPGKGL